MGGRAGAGTGVDVAAVGSEGLGVAVARTTTSGGGAAPGPATWADITSTTWGLAGSCFTVISTWTSCGCKVGHTICERSRAGACRGAGVLCTAMVDVFEPVALIDIPSKHAA